MTGISDEAVVAAAKGYFENCDYAEWDWIKEPARSSLLSDMRAALEAAHPLITMSMRMMTAVEIAAKERPEGMARARAEVRKRRKETTRKKLMEAYGEGWDAASQERDELAAAVEAALKLISPDDITPMGVRIIQQAISERRG